MISIETKPSHSPLSRRSIWHYLHLDPLLFGYLCLLSLAGLIILYSASSGNHAMVMRQSIRLVASFGILLMFAQCPTYKYQTWTPFLFTLGMALLITVLIIGKMGKGAQRWLDLGVFRFQPSELIKIGLPMMLAWFFAQQNLPPTHKALSLSALLILVPGLLIAKQPDLGTALLVIFSGCTIVFFAGISGRLMFSLAALCSIAMPLIWHKLHEYQKLRVLNFLNPERDPLGSGYHIIQSKIALGSGGLWGKGYLNGTQSHLHFLPEHATDFIFAVVGEEFGLVGCLVLICLFGLILYRSMQIAYQTTNTYAKLLAIGLSMNFFLSAFINMGMVTSILPVVGIPLPLVSYGGSSMLVLFASFGIIMAINADKHVFKGR